MILFFSHRSANCQLLLGLLQKQNLLSSIKLIDIDKIRLPPQLKGVPTLIVKTIPKPLMGKEVFNWFKLGDFFNMKNHISFNSNLNPLLNDIIIKNIKNDAYIKNENDKKVGLYTFIEDEPSGNLK